MCRSPRCRERHDQRNLGKPGCLAGRPVIGAAVRPAAGPAGGASRKAPRRMSAALARAARSAAVRAAGGRLTLLGGRLTLLGGRLTLPGGAAGDGAAAARRMGDLNPAGLGLR